MAISGVTDRGAAGSSTNSTTITDSPDSAIAVDKIAWVAVSANNHATSDGASTDHVLSDTDGHTWTRVFEHTNAGGGANLGVTVSLWLTKVTSEISTGDVITCTFPANNSDKCITIGEFAVGAGSTFAVEDVAHALGDGGQSVSLSGLTSREYLLFGTLGREGETASVTEDTDYTDLQNTRSTGLGGAAGNIAHHLGYRLTTLTADTYFPTETENFTALTSLSAVYESGGSTTFYETVAVTSTVTPALTRLFTFAKVLASASTMTATLTDTRTFARVLAATSTVSATLSKLKTFFRTLAVSSTMTAIFVKKVFKTLDALSTMTPVLGVSKLFERTLTAVSTMIAALDTELIFGRILAATSTMTATLSRQATYLLTLAVNSTFVVTMGKLISKTLAVSSTFVVTMLKGMFETLGVAMPTTAGLADVAILLRTLASSSTMTTVLDTLKIPFVGGAARFFKRSFARIGQFFHSGG